MSAPKRTVLLRISEAAKRLGVSRGTIYNLIAAGDLDVVDIAPTGSSHAIHCVPDDAVEALIASRRTNARSSNARRLRSA